MYADLTNLKFICLLSKLGKLDPWTVRVIVVRRPLSRSGPNNILQTLKVYTDYIHGTDFILSNMNIHYAKG